MKRRDSLLDIVKAMCLLMVMYMHCGGRAFGNVFCYIYLQPFYLISGILLGMNIPRIQDFGKFIARKATGLLIPYYGFGALALFIYWYYVPQLLEPVDIQRFLLGQRDYTDYLFTGALWFLTSLFITIVITLLISYIPNTLIKISIILAICSLHIYYPNIPYGWILNIDTLPMTLPFCYLGLWLGKTGTYNEYREKRFNPPVMIISLVLLWFANRTNGTTYIGIYKLNYGENFFYYLFGSIVGIIFLFEVGKLILIISTKLHFVEKIMGFIGVNSLIYLSLHQTAIVFVINMYDQPAPNNKVNWIVRLGICLVVCTVFAGIYSKIIKYKKGKAKK